MSGTLKSLLDTNSDLLSHGVWRSEYPHKQPIQAVALLIAKYHHQQAQWSDCNAYNYTNNLSQISRKSQWCSGMHFVVTAAKIFDSMRVENGVITWNIHIKNVVNDIHYPNNNPFLIGIIECKDGYPDTNNWNIDDPRDRQKLDFVALNQLCQIFIETSTQNKEKPLKIEFNPDRTSTDEIKDNDIFQITISAQEGIAKVMFKKNNITKNEVPISFFKKYTAFVSFRYGGQATLLSLCEKTINNPKQNITNDNDFDNDYELQQLQLILQQHNNTIPLASYDWDREIFDDL